MAIYSERDGLTILDSATDPEGDPLTVTEINGNPALIGVPISLSVGGSVTVASDGTVTFDDTGFTWPAQGNSMADSLLATISDGVNTVSLSVNLQLNYP